MSDQPKDITPATDALAEKLADVTFELLEQCQEKRENVARSLGLNVAEFKLLRKFGSQEVLSVNMIADRMELSSSRLTRILDGMVEKGIVRRQPDPDDRRVMNLSLTKSGREIQQRLSRQYIDTHRDILSHLPIGAGDSVVYAMERLREAMKKWSAGE